MARNIYEDIRDLIFRDVMNKRVIAILRVDGDGILAGMERLKNRAKEIGLRVLKALPSGAEVRKGDIIAVIEGNPKQIAIAEDLLIGIIAKASGVATAARKAVELAKGKIRVVCGAWKKMPIEIKELLREAIAIGGAGIRIIDKPFVYLDKNYVRIFGGIKNTLEAVKGIENRLKVIQVRGETKDIVEEAIEAVRYGANIIMIDTGDLSHIERVSKALRERGLRNKVLLAFGGNIKLEHIPILAEKDVDIIDVGREIIDAPLLDMKLDVIVVENSSPKNS